jgi:hypothetical protein
MYLLPALDCCIYVHLRLGCQTMVEQDLLLMRLYGERLGMARALAEHYASQVHARPLGSVTSGWSPLLERVTYSSPTAIASLEPPKHTFLPPAVAAPLPTSNRAGRVLPAIQPPIVVASPVPMAPPAPRHPSAANPASLEKPPASPADAELELPLPALFGPGYADDLLFAGSPTT